MRARGLISTTGEAIADPQPTPAPEQLRPLLLAGGGPLAVAGGDPVWLRIFRQLQGPDRQPAAGFLTYQIGHSDAHSPQGKTVYLMGMACWAAARSAEAWRQALSIGTLVEATGGSILLPEAPPAVPWFTITPMASLARLDAVTAQQLPGLAQAVAVAAIAINSADELAPRPASLGASAGA